jgi:salicylate hydroxylase
VDRRVTLLGDAAHPMLQYFAQGACMALEDGVCIAQMVERHGDDLNAAFVAYNKQRATRTGRLQMASRLIGEYVFHPALAKADVRNAILRSFSANDYYDRLGWLYGSIGLD